MLIPPAPPFDQQECHLGSSVWSVPRLVQLSANLPTITIPLNGMDLSPTRYDCNMREMITHFRQVVDADMAYPIILDEDGEIMDGRHRIMHALYNGHTEIKAKRFDTNPTPCRYKE
jgi:hypothetical protein